MIMRRPDLLQFDPGILGGTTVFASTRVLVQRFFDYLRGGDALDEFLEDFPSVSGLQAEAAPDLP